MSGRGNVDPTATVNGLGARWSRDVDAYASGELSPDRLVECVLCQQAPCQCPPFGSDEYLALMRQLHGDRAAGHRGTPAGEVTR